MCKKHWTLAQESTRNDEISKQQEIEVQISFIDNNMGTLQYYIIKPVLENLYK